LTFIAIFIVKIYENCYNFLALRRFSADVTWKNVIPPVHYLVSTF